MIPLPTGRASVEYLDTPSLLPLAGLLGVFLFFLIIFILYFLHKEGKLLKFSDQLQKKQQKPKKRK